MRRNGFISFLPFFFALSLLFSSSFLLDIRISADKLVHLQRRDIKSDFGVYVVTRQNGNKTYEESPTAVRVAMKAVFNSWLIFSPFIRLHLAIQTRKMGAEKDSKESTADIPGFIETYKIKLDELEQPDVTKYNSFNEFFFRKLKVGARVIDPDPNALVSAADCRLTAFSTIDDATRVWIKGASFSIASMLKDNDLAKAFDGGSLAIFRLAPQDYHRFHSPVDGTVVSNRDVKGTYYTVNPMAVRTDLDVFTENRRVITLLNSPQFGQVAFVQVGALLVGSIVQTGAKAAGSTVKKGDELGYFAYGGSTVVVVFQKGKVEFDKDLLKWSLDGLETYVRVGERIGMVGKGIQGDALSGTAGVGG